MEIRKITSGASTVTDAVIDDIRQWQNRPLERLYPVLFLDALFLKIRDQGHVIKKAVYVVIGINEEGLKEVLGLWVEQNEGAKFWMNILVELKNRGVEDVKFMTQVVLLPLVVVVRWFSRKVKETDLFPVVK